MVTASARTAPFTAGAAVIVFTAVFAAVAAGALAPGLTRAALVVAAIAAVVIWVTAEQYGGILTGQATDPNTGPLLILLAAAFWPGSRVPRLAGGLQDQFAGRRRLVPMREVPAAVEPVQAGAGKSLDGPVSL